jgi:lipid-A-disaccharide synthase
MTYDALAHSLAAAVTSGTATLEAAILGVPMVIVYRGSRLTELEWRLLGRRIKFVGMPNIILDRAVCPELIQEDASPNQIAEWMGKLIPDTPERDKMLADLSEVRAALGDPGAVAKTADLALKLLGVSPKG